MRIIYTGKYLTTSIYISTAGNVYVSGNYISTIVDLPSLEKGIVWKNGEELYTTSAEVVRFLSLFVTNSNDGLEEEDVFYCGYSNGEGKVWKNGQIYYTMDVKPYLIYNYQNNIYSVGMTSHVGGSSIMVSKNNENLFSISSSTELYSHSLCVSGEDVYIGGSSVIYDYNSIGKAKIWKNNEELYFFDGTTMNDAACMSVKVIDSDVYGAGITGNDGKVWKNGEELYSFPNVLLKRMFIDTHGVGIAEHEAEAGVRVYPNPAREQITVEFANVEQKSKWQMAEKQQSRKTEGGMAMFSLFDVQGRELLRQEIGDKESINVSRFVAGIYIYSIEFGGKKSTGKLVIN
ncbi:MAG: T9SS type A sorting domain-containing protein [Bacteroidales bacterium]|nr:T9SS type A sorting domain-containing protein [Bacteroidales bacterium]